MNLWEKLKFYLGLRCIAKFGDNYVITRRNALLLRECLDRNEEFWWTEGYWNKYCAFSSLDRAKQRNSVTIEASKPNKLKLTPLSV
ncbi:hypothetical protein [Pseudomonas sp. P8_250]|uniref:hypothetical protein n=1 Tax=Pseudomonas sp. P8_250 TaxID=3043446 RepID=UPI002A369A05|nr:hypothetical protein [Pseudomonas sp. P8_250]MDX9668706.1 hypothetical protein [Pseudomonas sp. P8_250]